MRVTKNAKDDKRRAIGRNIKMLREERKLSQTQLARLLWIDRTSLSGYEIGKRVPDIFMLCKLADVFGVSLDTLVGRGEGGTGKERTGEKEDELAIK